MSEKEMEAPVSRRELREELGVTRREVREELDATRRELRHEFEISRRELREELEILLGALLARMNDVRNELRSELRSELARLANAIMEHVASQIARIDEKYSDLPGRVTRLEEAERRPPPTRSRARPRR